MVISSRDANQPASEHRALSIVQAAQAYSLNGKEKESAEAFALAVDLAAKDPECDEELTKGAMSEALGRRAEFLPYSDTEFFMREEGTIVKKKNEASHHSRSEPAAVFL